MANGNPKFGSPEWDAKYGIKRFQKGGGRAAAPASQAAAAPTAAATATPTAGTPAVAKASSKPRGRKGGHRRPAHKPRGRKAGAHFIAGAIKKPGALHEDLGVPQGQTIPAAALQAAAHKPGKVGQRARFAMVLKGMH